LSGTYLSAVTLHVVAAMVWIGGMIFFAVAAPVLRDVPDDALRARLFDALGRRFRVVGWLCVGTLVASGIVQLRLRGWWGSTFWSRPVLFGTQLGVALVWKLGLVTAMIAVQAAHDFWLGPRAGQVAVGTEEAGRLRRRAGGLARLNAFLALALVYVAVRLGRGG
jgi:putative copper resistance protein D